MGSAQGKGVREGQAPQTKREISSQLPVRKEATWSQRKKEGRVRHVKEEPACTEWSSSKKAFNNVNKCMSMMLRLMLCLFQENKSYGVEPICIHPLMSCHCTSLCHVWHINKFLAVNHEYLLNLQASFEDSKSKFPSFFWLIHYSGLHRTLLEPGKVPATMKKGIKIQKRMHALPALPVFKKVL